MTLRAERQAGPAAAPNRGQSRCAARPG